MSEDPLNRIKTNLEAWEEGIRDPTKAQQALLQRLLKGYAKTEYGSLKNASGINTIEDYRRSFPVVIYADLEPIFRRVREEHYSVLLDEEPLTWVMTRGTTGGSKIIPVTQHHLQDLIKCGSRAVLNFSLRNGGLTLLAGVSSTFSFRAIYERFSQGEKRLFMASALELMLNLTL
jgi:hypothetical protein